MGYLAENGIKAVCFDIDGTFYPKWQTDMYLIRCALKHPFFSMRYNRMRQKMREEDGLDAGPLLNLREFRAKELRLSGMKTDIDSYIRKYEKYMLAPWQSSYGMLSPFDHVRTSVRRLRECGYITAALSDFPIEGKLEALGLDGLFDFAASTEDYGYLKPNARPFIEMLSELDVKPEETLYAGDSYSKDIIGAGNTGMHTLLIRKDAVKKEKYPLADLLLTSWQSFDRIIID